MPRVDGGLAPLDFSDEDSGRRRPLAWIGSEHPLQQAEDRARHARPAQLLQREDRLGVLGMDAGQSRTAEGQLAAKEIPERDAQRINVRARVDARATELLRTGERRRSDKAAVCQVPIRRTGRALDQAEVDDFARHSMMDTSITPGQHQVARFEVAVNEVAGACGNQGQSHLPDDFQGGVGV